MADSFPIDPVLPDLLDALRAHGRAVLQAPPGAGKTTRVPLAMLDADLCPGKIVMLEPRRLAARGAAERMAATLGETTGQRVGYRMRQDSKTGPDTRIEVVTEGILTRMIQRDPDLPGIGAVIFDEFHERSLNADLGLALTWELRQALRPDLLVVVMSATLDADPVARLLDDAPVITASGRAFAVDTRWRDRPLPKGRERAPAIARDIRAALDETEGGVLVFLPGERDIHAVTGALRLPADTHLHPLYGALPFAQQRAAIAPAPTGRKLVLATSIAETSLTLQDIRVVIDAGLARRARFDPNSGMSRLVTERATRAEAEQRRGRAGRVAPGVCYRLWTKGEHGAMAEFPPAEIETAELSALALELAQWGAQPADLAFLSPPPPGPFAEARALLHRLGALDDRGRISDHGRALARLPLHPRLAHMLLRAGRDGALLAALIGARDPLATRASDLGLRLAALKGADTPDTLRPVIHDIRQEAKRLRKLVPETATALSAGEMAALAYPDRIGLRRPGDDPRWVLSGGKGAHMDAGDALAGQRLLVATNLDGDAREARIRLAAPLTESELRALYGDQIAQVDSCEWSRRTARVEARRQDRFGALVLADTRWADAPAEQVARAMLVGVRELGLPFSDAARRFQARVELVRAQGGAVPDCSDAGLMADLDSWLAPHLGGIATAAAWRGFDLLPALRARLDWTAQQLVDRLAPARFRTPLGREVPIDYSGPAPEIAVRVQEMFGTTTHPGVGPRHQPLRITLLSPAGRPVQTTMDLPGFWRAGYDDLRKDMRGRYPKHPWPEDPASAAPTTRAKPRKG